MSTPPAWRLSVGVFCASRMGDDPGFADEARALGRMLAEREVRLVYGGGAVGLMGVVADAALEAGGQVCGVIPRSMASREVAHPGLQDLRIVDTMAERKTVMIDESDAFLVLPGGIGTLDELFEVVTLDHLGLIEKPLTLVDYNGFWGPLAGVLDAMAEAGVYRRDWRERIGLVGDVGACGALVEGWLKGR